MNKAKQLTGFLWLCGCCLLLQPAAGAQSAGYHTVSGTLTDAATGEQLISAIVSTGDGRYSTATNGYGYFSLSLPDTVSALQFNALGYQPLTSKVDLHADARLGTVALISTGGTTLREVKVTAEQSRLRRHIASTQMGLTDLPISLLKKVPAIAGEVDIIKALQLTPGVKRGGEGTIGMYVRGGNVDENLILLDEATVYNAGHLLGFFSVFNSSALKDVQLYKSSFPAQYGGRLSSIMDVRMKEGNLQDYHAEGSLGIISSNLTVEGPIVKDKASFILSGRRTYLDVVTGNQIPYHFYDLNGKINYIVSPRDRVYLSGYKGDDVLRISNAGSRNANGSSTGIQSSLKLGNSTGALRWNHIFKDPRLFSNVSLTYTRFRYNIEGVLGDNSLYIASSIRDLGGKADLSFVPDERHSLHFGGTLTNHVFRPNIVNTTGIISDALKSRSGRTIANNEFAVYFNDDWKISDRWQLNYGLRYTGIMVPSRTYTNPEPRIGARYLINDRNSVKASYSRMAQYMHLVASSSIALPTDLWYPVTAAVAPGISDQVSAGYYYTIPAWSTTVSLEGYYKWLKHQIEYREGAVLLLNDDYERELVKGKGWSYGLEFFASKTSGRFSGWLGYSLSYACRRFDSLNRGETYFARFDRRHDLSLVGAYDLGKRHALSASWVYSTGNPFTAQTGQYLAPNPSFTGIDVLPVYGPRNAIRLSASNRIDIDYAYKFRLGKKIRSELHFSVYNLMNRTQPSRVSRELNPDTGAFEYKQTGLFGAIPAFSLNLKY